MAKRARKGENVLSPKVEAFAEDLGRLLGTAQAKAQHWLGQRQDIVKHLTAVRDTASKLLADLGHEAQRVARRGRPSKSGQAAASFAPAPQSKRKRRKMSAAARKLISEAQKKRWAALRAKGK
ncbi:MAG TPA: hypothetical protein VGJ29_02845 [Vicinamibacterales bacterium]|jgi:hypothetical protein